MESFILIDELLNIVWLLLCKWTYPGLRIPAVTAASKKITTFWGIAPYSFEVARRFRRMNSLQHLGDDAVSMHLWNAGQLQPD
jgi:hypothetical protein